jgi:hypothetical protein
MQGKLVQPHRVYVREGPINVVTKKAIVQNYIFLFDDIVLLTKPKKKGEYKLLDMMAMSEVVVSDLPEDFVGKILTLIELNGRLYWIFCRTIVAADDYIQTTISNN